MASCVAHRLHRPKALTLEEHHVIPQAWQHFLAGSPLAPLFAPRTVTLAPTCHRNVHFWIVSLMRAGAGSDDPLAAKLSLFRSRRLDRQQAIAYEALTGFMGPVSLSVGHPSLEDLRAHALLGYA